MPFTLSCIVENSDYLHLASMNCKNSNTNNRVMKKIFSDGNLRRAARKIANYYRLQNYNGSPDAALALLEQESVLRALREAVLDGGYQFQPLRPYITPKNDGKPRIENMSSALDRIVVQALLNEPGWKIQQQLSATATIGHTVIAPAYRFQSPSRWYVYSQWQREYRYFKRTCLKFAHRRKTGHVLHLDIQQFYPTVSRDRLRGMLEPWFTPDAWAIMNRYLNFTTVRDGKVIPFGNGLPIEEPSSRLFANLYLQPLDYFIIYKLGIPYTRYMDDMYFFLPSKEAADTCRQQVTEFLALQLGLFTNGKNYDQPVKEFLEKADVNLSQELSAVDHHMAILPFSPGLRAGLEATLTIMLKGMPGPNANPDAEGHQEKLKKASFAAYRVAKLKLKNQEDPLALSLSNEKTRYMAVVALCLIDSPAANQRLTKFFQSGLSDVKPFELIRIAGSLLRYGKDALLGRLEKRASKSPELLAIVRQGSGGPTQIRTGLRHTDPLVRKAAALRLIHMPARDRSLAEDLVQAAIRETDRDTLALILIATINYCGNPQISKLHATMRHHEIIFIRRLAKKLINKKAAIILAEFFIKKEIQSCLH